MALGLLGGFVHPPSSGPGAPPALSAELRHQTAQTTIVPLEILESDPQGPAAMGLLNEAASEARHLYPELYDPAAPCPTNSPNPPRGVYFVAFAASHPVGMGGHRPLDEGTTEVRRMFVTAAARNQGVARAVLKRIEEHARLQGFSRLVLETGNRQLPAIRLYEATAFIRIPPFGIYANDPTSVCFAKNL